MRRGGIQAGIRFAICRVPPYGPHLYVNSSVRPSPPLVSPPLGPLAERSRTPGPREPTWTCSFHLPGSNPPASPGETPHQQARAESSKDQGTHKECRCHPRSGSPAMGTSVSSLAQESHTLVQSHPSPAREAGLEPQPDRLRPWTEPVRTKWTKQRLAPPQTLEPRPDLGP